MHTSAARALALRTSGVTYPGSIEHVRAVPADLRALLHDWPVADDLILCVSELAANADLHSHSHLPGGTVTVRPTVNPGRGVRIEVEDNGGPWIAPPDDATGHHGLDIVRALTIDWGIDGYDAAPHHLGTLRLARVTAADATRVHDVVVVRTFFTVFLAGTTREACPRTHRTSE